MTQIRRLARFGAILHVVRGKIANVVQNISTEGFVGKKKATSFIDEIISDNATDKGIRIAAIKSVTTIMDKKDAKPLLEILEDSSKSDDDKIKDIQKYIETM